jgi:hypothetical protein
MFLDQHRLHLHQLQVDEEVDDEVEDQLIKRLKVKSMIQLKKNSKKK